jgi:hypothetical protein
LVLELVEADVPVPDGRRLFDSGGIWQVFRHGRWLLYTFRPPPGPGAPARGVLIDEARRRGRLFLPAGPFARRPGFALSYPLEELLFQHHAARRGALVLHACGIRRPGGALVFCGESGAGKSTTARLWRRHRRDTEVLSDDRVVLRTVRGRFRVFGTPWHGSGRHASPSSAPVAALFFLRAGRASEVSRLSSSEAAARLLARSFLPPWDARAVAGALAAARRVTRALPCFELRFRPDRSSIVAAESALATVDRRGPRRS